jgi:hypothetical protein
MTAQISQLDLLRKRLLAGQLDETIAIEEINPAIESLALASELTAEIFQAVRAVEATDRQEGDWIDDVVSTYHDGKGFGEEVRSVGEVKLQINLAMDVSGSMFGMLCKPAGLAMRILYDALMHVTREIDPQFFRVHSYLWAAQSGRTVYDLQEDSVPSDYWSKNSYAIGDTDKIFDDVIANNVHFEGQDTFLLPLFDRVHKREQEDDDGFRKLDVIISDGIWKDGTNALDKIRKIQHERGQIVQSIVLNFMTQEQIDRSQITIPERTWMYPVTPLTVRTIMQQIVSEFVVRQS